MMQKIFLDTNVVVDIVQKREGEQNVRKILAYAASDQWVRLYVSYLSMANLAFIVRKAGITRVKDTIKDIMDWCDVVSSSDAQIMHALKCDSPDFEDSLQIACAESKNCDVIITRNPKHFSDYTEIPVISPEEFVNHCDAQ